MDHYYCSNPTSAPWGVHPCRKCAGCHSWKRYQWKYRLLMESKTATRTWFFTATFRFAEETPNLRDSWQRYMKRIRKLFPMTKFRYFCSLEHGGKNGRKHLHALIFCSTAITRRELDHSWQAGYSRCKLAKTTDISYLLKYVTKEETRVWCSQNLGYTTRPRTDDKHTHPQWYIEQFEKRTNKTKDDCPF